ncbi:MAG: hypothetical protein AAF384_06490 [Pseudomonadota bacterium]
MSFWIAAWLFLFSTVLFVATLSGAEERRKTLPVTLLSAATMIVAGWIMWRGL